MILYELVEDEQHPAYRVLSSDNIERQYGFPTSIVNEINQHLEIADALTLAAYCLWRLNHIHPFINGNGRTARALCYYVVCVKFGGPLPGAPILPELIRQNRDAYVRLLRSIDAVSGEHRDRALNDLRLLVCSAPAT